MQSLSQRVICESLFIAALFTRAKRWKQAKGPPTRWWINKTWFIQNDGILFGLKTGRRFYTCHNMDEPWGLYAKRHRPVAKRQTLYDSTWMGQVESSRSEKQKVGWWLPRAGGRGDLARLSKGQSFSSARGERSEDWLRDSMYIVNTTLNWPLKSSHDTTFYVTHVLSESHLCPTLCNPMDCIVHEILAKIL